MFQAFIVFALGAFLIFIGKKSDSFRWKLVFGAMISNYIAHSFFSGGGSLSNPAGDGLVTAFIRNHFNDGPEVLIAFPFAIVFGYVIPFILLRKIAKSK